MGSKTSIVSKILFSLSAVLFLIFVGTVFFAGQKVGGAIFFMIFATEVAFAFLDRKYHSNYIDLYRYSVYLADATNILAVGTIIYYGQDVPFMIVAISILGVSMIVDLLMRNSSEKRRWESRLARLLNCVFMLVIFPYFFGYNFSIAIPIIAVVAAVVVLVLKVVFAVVPVRGKVNSEENLAEEELDQSVGKNRSHENVVE